MEGKKGGQQKATEFIYSCAVAPYWHLADMEKITQSWTDKFYKFTFISGLQNFFKKKLVWLNLALLQVLVLIDVHSK